jgi:hypothetical protein
MIAKTTTTGTAINHALIAIGNAIEATAEAIATTTRRLIRTGHVTITVTRRHVPAWIAGLLTICLIIPGPVDELLVLLVIAGMAAFKPAMRADFADVIPQAWAD